MNRCTAIGALFWALAACAAAADRDFSIEAQPLFVGTESPSRIQPFLITIENRGRGTRGVVDVSTSDFSMAYPIDLPQGSRKRIIAYVTSQYSVEGSVVLRTPEGGAAFKIETHSAMNPVCVAVVSDAPGDYGFLRTLRGRQVSPADVYLKPDLMPDRTAGYAGVHAVVLSEGAERMNDEAFVALKRYVIAGGCVVVSGGASMPILGDARWRQLFPVLDPRPQTVRLDGNMLGMTAVGEVTVGVGRLAPLASVRQRVNRIPILVERRYGLGRIVYYAFNLTEGNARNWIGRAEFVKGSGVLVDQSRFANMLSFAMPEMFQSYYTGGSYVPSMPSGMPFGGTSDEDPFSVTVPETSTVMLILAAYLILVVPVNLLLLKKLGKGEWAWVTSPIISLAFAAIFFRFSAGLYAAELSTSSTGVLVARQGEPEAYYLGRSQMFFPRGGRYDLKLEGVEAIFPQTVDSRSGMGSIPTNFGAVDTGSIACRPSVSNLSFRDFAYVQRSKVDRWFDIRVDQSGGKPKSVTLTNRSPHTLTSVGVLLRQASFSFENLRPGESRTSTKLGYTVMDPVIEIASFEASQGQQGVLTAILEGFEPGPQLGNIVQRHHRNWLLYTFEDEP